MGGCYQIGFGLDAFCQVVETRAGKLLLSAFSFTRLPALNFMLLTRVLSVRIPPMTPSSQPYTPHNSFTKDSKDSWWICTHFLVEPRRRDQHHSR